MTIKFRKGFDEEHINAVEIAKIAEANGASAVAVHGRTREQYYSGKADWDIIKEVKAAVQIPVIGNGDIFTPQDAKKSVGAYRLRCHHGWARCAGQPLDFQADSALSENRRASARADRTGAREKALRHSQMLIAYKGEYIGIREMRKHMAWYMKGLPGAAELRGKLNYAETMAEMKALLHEYLKDHQ